MEHEWGGVVDDDLTGTDRTELPRWPDKAPGPRPVLTGIGTMLTAGRCTEHDGVTCVVEPFELGPVCCRLARLRPVIRWGRTRRCSSTRSGRVRYPLRAWVVVLHKGGAEWQRRITALQLVTGEEPARSWTMSLLSGQDVAWLNEDGYFGYGVDSGTATLADRVTIQVISAWTARPGRASSSSALRCRRAAPGRWHGCGSRLDARVDQRGCAATKTWPAQWDAHPEGEQW